MKQLASYNRVAGYLNKVFDILNEEFFECELSRPTITIQSSPKAYRSLSFAEAINFIIFYAPVKGKPSASGWCPQRNSHRRLGNLKIYRYQI